MLLSGVLEKKLSEHIRLTYFNVIEYEDFAKRLDECLVSIWFGPKEQRSLEVTKRKVRNYYESKLGDRSLLCGSCAEFFLHIYLGQAGYRQACLASNLEEGSIKKGFDGFYLKGDQCWLMQSKSAINGSASHLSKVEEAYRDLCNKLNDFSNNDPWENALNHAFAAGIEESILKQIRSLSDDFTLACKHEVSEFNMIPCGKVFIDKPLTNEQVGKLSHGVCRYFKDRDYSALHIICVSHSALIGFLRYLGLEYKDE